MFFRRIFSRKDNGVPTSFNSNNNENHQHTTIPLKSPKRIQRRLSSSDDTNKRSLSVLQLTPLWEHIIRTRKLPEDIDPVEMFQEFYERLKDPEWQVRQHALRVLVDVLTVIGPKADTYFGPLMPQLVENLGHPAPTVRKGALECLRVYIVETAMPETILLEILDIGLNQRITNEPFGGRLTCGVMLSLPSLVQATLHTTKRSYILRSTIEMLINKMSQVTHQEITLKVLLKLKELIGPREFSEYMSHATYREFDVLCNVYGIGEKNITNANRSSWHMSSSCENDESMPFNPSEFWRSLDGNYNTYDTTEDNGCFKDNLKDKVIMETEIKINDDTLTMRILETTKTDTEEDTKTVDNFDAADDTDNGLDDIILENSGLIQVLSDSELEEINKNAGNINEDYVRRTPKRVTFGGEIVKMRTPDSDTVTQSDGDDVSNKIASKENKLSFLKIDIPNDNTKPITTVKQTIKSNSIVAPSKTSSKSSPIQTLPLQSSSTPNSPSPKKKSQLVDEHRPKSGSPRSPFKRINVSPVDSIISPRPIHKEVEVLHNLQRSPHVSPRRSIRSSSAQQLSTTNIKDFIQPNIIEKNFSDNEFKSKSELASTMKAAKSWEDLGLVNDSVMKNLKSGDWRLRSHAISEIEEALKSSENLALIQPYLESLLRTLLSSEKNYDVAEDKRRVIMNLISRLPLDNLENRIGQIITGLCRQGGPGSNRVSKALMQRLPPAVIVLKLLSDEFLHAKSSRFRENALQMVMYALMTFPSTLFDTKTCVTRATYAAFDRKKRVRQASLDVLAVLGQVTSPRIVMDIVQNIAEQREDGISLCKAVKARLARKQLPIVSPDGFVQYALRIPSPQINEPEQLAYFGADIEWIASGIGSVSPTSLKRRISNNNNNNNNIFYQSITQNMNPLNGKIYVDPNRENNNENRHQKPYNFDIVGGKPNDITNNRFIGNSGNLDGSNIYYPYTVMPMQVSAYKTTNNGGAGGDIIGIFGKRIGTKSCSDSSQDGRSSDSTSGSSGRYTKLPVTSRFPTMERLNVTDLYIERQSFRSPYDSTHSTPHGLNSTFPKTNYPTHQKKISKTINHDTYTESSYESSSYSNGNNSERGEVNLSQNPKRFMNVDKFKMHSNKQQYQPQCSYHHENNIHQPQEQKNDTCDIQKTPEYLMKSEKPVDYHDSISEKSNEKTRSSSKDDRNQEQTSNNPSENSLLSEGKISSGHSSPTRVMDHTSTTPTNSQKSNNSHTDKTSLSNKNLEQSPNQSKSSSNYETILNSRPQSQLSKKSSTLIVENQKSIESSEFKEKQNLILNGDVKHVTVEDSIIQNLDEEIEKILQPTEISQEVENKSTTLENDKYDDLDAESHSINQNISEIIGNINTKPIDLESPARSPVPTMEVKPITREKTFKNCESIFEVSAARQDNDTKSTASTETSSDYQANHATSLDNQPHTSPGFVEVKPRHRPLMCKSKTAFFNRNRKISPVKQSMKINKTETFPPNLTRFDKPKEAMNIAINQLDSSSWETIMIGLKSLVRLMRYHPDILDAQIHMVCMQLSKSVRNLRSQVARAACQAANELFTIHSKYLEIECDDLVGSLLHRTADTNRFLRADATRALESMCDSLTPPKILHLLTTRGAIHQNALVRTTAAKLLNRLADRLGSERIFSMNREQRDKFILTGANLLLEGSLETRSYAKALFRLLSEHQSYNRVLLEIIPTKLYRNIEKSLKNVTR